MADAASNHQQRLSNRPEDKMDSTRTQNPFELFLVEYGKGMWHGRQTPARPALSRSGSNVGSLEAEYNLINFLKAPKPENESRRLKAMKKYQLTGDKTTSGQTSLQRLSKLIQRTFDVRCVLINLVGDDEVLVQAAQGHDAKKFVRNTGLAAHVVLQKESKPLVITDPKSDWRFERNTEVVNNNIKFYVGHPIQTEDGLNIGTICLLDPRPRSSFSVADEELLSDFALMARDFLTQARQAAIILHKNEIQEKLDAFTRDCFAMTSKRESMDDVYNSASRMTAEALGADGCFILDLSSLELSADGFRLKPQTPSFKRFLARSSADMRNSGSIYVKDEDLPPSVFDCSLSVLGNFGTDILPVPLIPASQQALFDFLTTSPNGNLYESPQIPSWLSAYLPKDAEKSLCAPIFNANGNPFILVVAHSTRISAPNLDEDFEKNYLLTTGLVVLSCIQKRKVELADQAKAQFIANMSHELRSPLHGVSAAAELLHDTDLTETQLSYLHTIQTCSHNLLETFNHVLDFTRLKKDEAMDPTLAVTDLSLLIEEAVESCFVGFGHESSKEKSIIGTAYEPPSSTPSLKRVPSEGFSEVEYVIDLVPSQKDLWKARCDSGGIRRCLMNLLNNSSKFTKTGYIHVSLRASPSSTDPLSATFELCVTDTGKGIEKSFLKNRLFSPFAQADSISQGTGLGLAIVDSIAKRLDGTVDVQSEEGKGTEIKLTFSAEVQCTGSPPLSPRPLPRVSTYLEGFEQDQTGQVLLSQVIQSNLDSWNIKVLPQFSTDASFIIVNESISAVEHHLRNSKSTYGYPIPIIYMTCSRKIRNISSLLVQYEQAGGYIKVLFKPCGSGKLESAIRLCLDAAMHRPASTHDQSPLPLIESPIVFTTRSGTPSSEHPSAWDSTSTSGSTRNTSNDSLSEPALPPVGPSTAPRVLIVDDNSINRKLLAAFMKKKKFLFDEAVDGVEGVDLFAAHPAGYYDVCLMDISMPRRDGKEATRMIRALEKSRGDEGGRLKIFALTGLGADSDREDAFSAGVDGYFTKPVSLKALTNIVLNQL